MINLLLGAPGGGKSYEACVFHILPALEKGRKVVTNLPLNVEEWGLIDPAFPALIELRTETKAVRPVVDWEKAQSMYQKFGIAHKQGHFNPAAFAHADDYGHPWRHPEHGTGPLYVIDECHLPLPSSGTPIKVEEWYSLHRHESADVLLITQSYGKINRAVRDLVQVVYRVRKNVAFGSSNSYTRKVQDGLRGDVVNTSIRKYHSRYFKLYRSHTRGGGAELGANDIVPIWRRWPVIGAALFLSAAAVMASMGWLNPFRSAQKPQASGKTYEIDGRPVSEAQFKAHLAQLNGTPPATLATPPGAPQANAKPAGQPAPSPQAAEAEKTHPLAGRTLHFAAAFGWSKKAPTDKQLLFTVAQNGLPVMETSASDLRAVGYRVEYLAPCFARIGYAGWSDVIICDRPQVSVTPPADGLSSGSNPPQAVPSPESEFPPPAASPAAPARPGPSAAPPAQVARS